MGKNNTKPPAIPEIHQYQCVLKSKEGQFVVVKSFNEGLKLCAIDRQKNPDDPGDPVIVWKNDKNQLAFKFKRSDKLYTLKVDGEALTLEDEIDAPSSLTENHWFEKYNVESGEHYSLRSVVEPRGYLFIEPERPRKIFISQTSQDGTLIREIDVVSLPR